MHRSQSRAFTLVELLVVIAIIGILVALLLPAIQAAREAARRSQCSNNLRQLAIGLHNYHDTHGTLPAAAYCGGGVVGTSAINNCHTWIATLFPFIEQGAIHDQIDFGVANNRNNNPDVLNNLVIGTLMCPSDPDRGLYPNSRESAYTPIGPADSQSLGANYVVCAGPLHMNTCPIPAMSPNINCKSTGGARMDVDAPGMFNGGRRAYHFALCNDGTSNTFLLGESLPVYSSFHMYFASHMHIGSNNPPPNYHRIYTACPKSRDQRISNCFAHMGGFKSMHPGGLHMAMVDASVVFINESIDYRTWVLMGDKDSGQPIGSF